jgi:gliding motility-associated-like protein
MRLITILFFSLIAHISFAQISGNSLILNGTTDWIEVPNNSSLNINDISGEAWVYTCSTSGVILSKSYCSGDQSQYSFSINSGFLSFNWSNDGNCGSVNTYRSSASVISTLQWYHVAFTHTSSGVSLFVNGSQIAGGVITGSFTSIQSGTAPLLIGVYRFVSGAYGGNFKGRIDEVRVWNVALSPSQIASRYNIALTGSEAGLVAYYDMEQTGSGSGLTIPNDATSTGVVNNGTTIGTGGSPFFLNNSSPLDCNNICPIPTVNIGNDTTLCTGANLILNAGTGFSSYLWQDNSSNDFFNAAGPGKYWVRVQNNCGTASDTINISSSPSIDIGSDTTICNGDNIILNPGTGFSSYLWQDNSTNGFFNATSPGKYWVTGQNPCSSSDTITISYSELLIPNLITPNADHHNDLFEIQGGDGSEIEIELFNIWGSPIYKNKSYKNDWGDDQLSEGLYYYILDYPKCNKKYKGWFHVLK